MTISNKLINKIINPMQTNPKNSMIICAHQKIMWKVVIINSNPKPAHS